MTKRTRMQLQLLSATFLAGVIAMPAQAQQTSTDYNQSQGMNEIEVTATRRTVSLQTAPINIKGLISAMPELRKMTVLKPKEFCPQIKKCLADCGIALVFLPHLKGSFLQGASFMDGNKIVVGLTARGKDADKFWFSLFHELAHIALGHVGQPNGTSEDDEKAADKWSGETLITSEEFEAFRRGRDYSERSVLQFAKEQGIAPGIVVGRMQLEGMIKYSMLNNLKEKYEIAV